MGEKYRLVTRSDFDGLVCAMILRELDMLEDIKFVHPKDMQDGKIAINDRDITTNLPYVEGVHLAFDHHASEADKRHPNFIDEADSPSAARVVYNYYGGKAKLPRITDEIMEAVDKADSAQFTREEILNPTKWVLLSFIMDARTGLGRFHDFTVSNYDLMMELIGYCMDHTIDEVLELPNVRERVDMYFKQQKEFKAQLQKVGKMHGSVVVLYLKDEDVIYTGNRFLVYAEYPDAKVSIHVMWGLKKQNTALTIGKSIFDRTAKINIGDMCASYGGGGHKNAGTCQVENDKADEILDEIINKINMEG